VETPRRTSVPLTPDSSLLIGRYAVGDELGRGGAAIVYRATDRQTGSEVAIKMLRPQLAGAVMAERFRREVRVAARLQHPNILPVIDTGDTPEGIHFYAMPLMTGGALVRRLAREGPLPYRDVVRIAEDVAAALDYAHDCGVLHRDVKPENVLFDGTRAVVADFGIARTVAELDKDRLTESGAVIGTPLYMSPEQADANGRLDRRSDVYSFGCLIYEMLAGEPPFGGTSVQSVLAKHVHAPVPRLATVRQTAPEGVQQVLETALAKVPADRYATAGELVRALSAALADARSTPPTVPPVSRSSRRTRVWIAGAVVAIVAAVVIGLELWPRGAPLRDPSRIAVLYFSDLSREGATPSLADGLTESLISQLSRVEALSVESPDDVRPYRNRTTPVDSIARQLGVGTIIHGSVQRAGDSVLASVWLVDATTGKVLHTETIRGPEKEIIRGQDSVMNDVAFALRQRLGDVVGERKFQPTTKSTQAWEAELGASRIVSEAYERHQNDVDDEKADDLLLRADSLYARAESLDPRWPLPTLKRAIVARIVATWGDSIAPPERSAPPGQSVLERWSARAIRLAGEALKKGQDTADFLDLRGSVYLTLSKAGAPGVDTLRRAAERDLRASVDRRPRGPFAWASLADLYLSVGRDDDALGAAQRAYQADAFFELPATTISRAFRAALNLRRFNTADFWCQMGLRRHPDSPRFAFCRLQIVLLAGASKATVDSAWNEIARVEHGPFGRQVADSWGYNRAMVAALAVRVGLRDSARHIIAQIRPHRRTDGSPALGRLEEAYVDLLLGDRDAALHLIAEQLRQTPAAREAVAANAWFESLHEDSLFKALVRRQP
jgi:serine/threonine-protein kinase